MKADPRTDLQLVQACNTGSKAEAIQAFEVLYQRHKAYVLKVAMRFLPDRDQALDVLQETFSYLLRKFPPPGAGLELTAQLTTFLYPVVKHNAIAIRKKSQRLVSDENIPEPMVEDHHADTREEVAGLFYSLSEERKEVLLLRFVDGFKLDEIAKVLDIPLGTVKSRIHLALSQLRDDPNTKKFFES